jgi:hypothetical protein
MPLPPQLLKDDARRGFLETAGTAVAYNVRLPPAVDTAPAVALEALDSEFVVVPVIAALVWRATLPVSLATALSAAATTRRRPAATIRTVTLWKSRHFIFVACASRAPLGPAPSC